MIAYAVIEVLLVIGMILVAVDIANENNNQGASPVFWYVILAVLLVVIVLDVVYLVLFIIYNMPTLRSLACSVVVKKGGSAKVTVASDKGKTTAKFDAPSKSKATHTVTGPKASVDSKFRTNG